MILCYQRISHCRGGRSHQPIPSQFSSEFSTEMLSDAVVSLTVSKKMPGVVAHTRLGHNRHFGLVYHRFMCSLDACKSLKCMLQKLAPVLIVRITNSLEPWLLFVSKFGTFQTKEYNEYAYLLIKPDTSGCCIASNGAWFQRGNPTTALSENFTRGYGGLRESHDAMVNSFSKCSAMCSWRSVRDRRRSEQNPQCQNQEF